MDLDEMRTIVRRDLHDEDGENYRWTDDELDRHIGHAVKDFSRAVPLQQKTEIATTSGSREIDISSLADRVMLEAVEYPLEKFPKAYQRFSIWADILTLLGDEVPDGSDAAIYYGNGHTLDGSSSTIPPVYEDLVAAGACGYAAVEWAINAVNRVNTGGAPVPEDFLRWSREKLDYFRQELKRAGRNSRVRSRRLYRPYNAPVSRTTDYGP